MTKSILVYFKSENDAESAHASLQRLRVSDLFVDEIPEAEQNRIVVPLFNLGTTSTNAGIIGSMDEQGDQDMTDDSLTHLLEGQVDEADYEEAMQVLSDSKGYRSRE